MRADHACLRLDLPLLQSIEPLGYPPFGHSGLLQTFKRVVARNACEQKNNGIIQNTSVRQGYASPHSDAFHSNNENGKRPCVGS